MNVVKIGWLIIELALFLILGFFDIALLLLSMLCINDREWAQFGFSFILFLLVLGATLVHLGGMM